VNDVPSEGGYKDERLISADEVSPNQLLHAFVSRDLRTLFNQPVSTERSKAYELYPDEVEKVLLNIPKMPRKEYRTGHECYGVYIFLAGLAVENILKCICIVRHPELTSSPKLRPFDEKPKSSSPNKRVTIDGRIYKIAYKLDNRLDTHDVYSLAVDKKKLHLTLNRDERRILNKLKEYIVWAGRYPIPGASGAHKSHLEGENNPYSSKNRTKFPKDDKSIQELYHHLLNILNDELRGRLSSEEIRF
jgi:hypothetical protein